MDMEFATQKKNEMPRKSLVRVCFPGKAKAFLYYNDLFDLKVGDLVYVEGEMASQYGRVVDINYHFKIKLSDYWKVIARIDTNVHGQFYMAGTHFVTFDPAALPAERAVTWFKVPNGEDEDDTVCCCDDDERFPLDDLSSMKITPVIAARGHEYYLDNRVCYICLNGCRGYAIVEGTENYTVDFEYRDGQISRLVCDCPCGFHCKHEFAAMLQLKEILLKIETHYADRYDGSYFAAITKNTLFTFAVDGKENNSFTL